MQLIGRGILDEFKNKYADSRSYIDSWEKEVEEAQWNSPHDVKRRYPKSSILTKKRVIFNINGNKYRLCVIIDYGSKIVLAKKIAIHSKYDKWNLD
jgi:mRNA interferase HigB